MVVSRDLVAISVGSEYHILTACCVRFLLSFEFCGKMEDDDWFEPQAQGSSSDPLVEQEYQRLLNRYSDVGFSDHPRGPG